MVLRYTLLISLCVLIFSPAFGQTADPAADFTATDIKGEEFSLEALRGKVVVLDFWSTRCVVCHGELPNLNKMVGEFKDKEVVFLAITMEDESKIDSYLKKNRFDFNIIPNGFGILLRYAERDSEGRINMPYPSYYVIGPDGRLAFRASGAGRSGQVGSAIRKLLASGGASQ